MRNLYKSLSLTHTLSLLFIMERRYHHTIMLTFWMWDMRGAPGSLQHNNHWVILLGGIDWLHYFISSAKTKSVFFYCTGERSRELVEQSGVQSEGASNAHAVFTGFIQRPPRDTTHKWETHCPFKTTQGPRTAYEWCIKWLFWNVIIIIITGYTLGLHSNHHHGYADMNRKHAGCCLHTSSWYPQCSVDIGSLISLDTQSWSWSRSWIC